MLKSRLRIGAPEIANLLALEVVHQLVGTLAAANVPVVVLKGAALAFTLYGDPACRPLGDIDLLVPANQVVAALQELGRLGYRPPPGSLAENVAARLVAGDDGLLRRCGEVTLLRCGRLPTQLDLHWGLNGREALRQRMDADWFSDHTRLVPMGRQEVRVLDEAAQLLHLCAHTLQHGVPRLRWTYDLALCWRAIPWHGKTSRPVPRSAGLGWPCRAAWLLLPLSGASALPPLCRNGWRASR